MFNFELIHPLALVFLLLTLKMQLPAGLFPVEDIGRGSHNSKTSICIEQDLNLRRT